MSGRVRVLVLQWAYPGRADELRAVEDELTPLARSHGARVHRDVALPLGDRDTGGEPPDEVHLVDFPDRAAFEAFLADPARAPLSAHLREVLDRHVVWQLETLDDAPEG